VYVFDLSTIFAIAFCKSKNGVIIVPSLRQNTHTHSVTELLNIREETPAPEQALISQQCTHVCANVYDGLLKGELDTYYTYIM